MKIDLSDQESRLLELLAKGVLLLDAARHMGVSLQEAQRLLAAASAKLGGHESTLLLLCYIEILSLPVRARLAMDAQKRVAAIDQTAGPAFQIFTSWLANPENAALPLERLYEKIDSLPADAQNLFSALLSKLRVSTRPAATVLCYLAAESASFLPDGVTARLTPRQLECLDLIAWGCTTQELAEHLGVDDVNGVMRQLLSRLLVDCREEAALLYVRAVLSAGRRIVWRALLPFSWPQDEVLERLLLYRLEHPELSNVQLAEVFVSSVGTIGLRTRRLTNGTTLTRLLVSADLHRPK